MGLCTSGWSADVKTDPVSVSLNVENWPADGKVLRPDGVGNITAAYYKHDAERSPITVEFNKDATVVTLHVGNEAPAEGREIILELAEHTGALADGRMVFSALDSKVVGKQAKLETHPGNHRIGFWGNANDYVTWNGKSVDANRYAVELTYSTASPSGTEVALEIAGSTLNATLESTGSWYKYTTIPVGTLTVSETGQVDLAVKCTKKVGGAVMNLKAVTLRPVQ
jgi:hypothetical protein